MTAKPTLIDSSGRPITSAEIQQAKVRASISGFNPSPWPYDAAQMFGPDMAEWFPYLRSPDSEINFDTDRMRARARDLVRNDGWATGSISRIADAVVGSTFYPVPQPNWRYLARASDAKFDAAWAAEFRSAVMAEWRMWGEDPNFYCDASQSMTAGQMLYLGLRHKLVDGEALAMPLWMPERMGYGAAHYATSLQIIDPDRLSNPFEAMDTHWLRGGVEVDDSGAPVAYHIRRAHQNDYYDAGLSMIWDRFERRTPWGRPLVVHDLDRDRAQQHRGLGLLTPVLARFKVLSKYDQVALQAAILRTVVGFFVKSAMDPDQVREMMSGDDADQKLTLSGYQRMRFSLGESQDLMLGGVRVPVLGPGDDISKASAGGEAEDFDSFEHTILRSISAATGETAEEISKDYSKTNYSSARAAMQSVWRTMMRRRADYASGFCTPIYSALLEEMIDRGNVPLPNNAPDFVEMRAAFCRAEWIGPGRGWVDPLKERQGEVLGLDAGFGTLARTCSDISGLYWEDVLDQRAIEEAAMHARDLSLPDWAGGEIATKVEKPQ